MNYLIQPHFEGYADTHVLAIIITAPDMQTAANQFENSYGVTTYDIREAA